MDNLIFHDFEKPTEEEIKEINEYAQGFIKDAKRDLEDVKVLYQNKRWCISRQPNQSSVWMPNVPGIPVSFYALRLEDAPLE